MTKVFVTGGGGYVGHVLVPRLLDEGHEVVVYDTFWFGDRLPDSSRLRRARGDIRDADKIVQAAAGCHSVINLACVSNDTSFALDERLSTSINRDAFAPMVRACERAGIRRFINASTSSVYGVSDEPEVFEDHPKVPLTYYNRFKWECEQMLAQLNPQFEWVTIRPATLCGYSPRCRLDLSVNILTNHAVNKGIITVFGGEQKRPNLHIADMVDAYMMMLGIDGGRIDRQTYNCGIQNLSIMEIARRVKMTVEEVSPDKAPIDISVTQSDDKRSYHINSDKIRNELGFKARRSIEDAVSDLCHAFDQGLLPNSFTDERYYNVKTLQSLAVT